MTQTFKKYKNILKSNDKLEITATQCTKLGTQTWFGHSESCQSVIDRLRTCGTPLIQHNMYARLPACTFLSCVMLINRSHIQISICQEYFLSSMDTSTMLR